MAKRAADESMTFRRHQSAFTLVELLVSLAMAALLVGALRHLLGVGTGALASVDIQVDLNRQARFAMQRMMAAASASDRLLLPLADNPSTSFSESIRVQTVPASPPGGSSLLATAVLAITLDRSRDIDANGVADADNDGDGRIDEDPGSDLTRDAASGIVGIDDDGDGLFDEPHLGGGAVGDDDDEDGIANEDAKTMSDDDLDGTADEDPDGDVDGDSSPGVAGVDDDGDGAIDEGDANDDDEDGMVDEDWLDPVVFYLLGSTVVERRPVPWDENGNGVVDGRDYVESVIASNVTLLRFELISVAGGAQLVDITLTLVDAGGTSVSLNTRVRVDARE